MSPDAPLTTARMSADPDLPVVRIERDFRASPQQVLRAHTDPELFARWIGPHDLTTRITRWDATTGGAWAYTAFRTADPEGESYSFHGSFHDVLPDRIVQTFTYDAWPEAVTLETVRVEDIGDGLTRLHGCSLFDSFASREQMLASDMETGVQQGYEALDALLTERGEQR
ncbi:SRPBCC domain-containing protein [Brachybacterium sp. ACRRE]|uniref:SRPBCC domain-containing protein n=1 Tax=Brachybacterium sp. ACRRE TaxID=2918184 RepID=UPI001EF226DB|nr:SRPBCC domain-containing protein [Brachybacterium sp. ACRRE]MCG7309558.1 SRPBCC domain-containing protein [Brachybacterium sp. ACRRE]